MLAGVPAAGGELQCELLVTAEGVRLCHATVGGVSPDQRRRHPGHRVAPKTCTICTLTSRVPFAFILRNGREWKPEGAKCTRLGLSCAPRLRDIAHGVTGISGFGLGCQLRRVGILGGGVLEF
jgi:hypothetical protein